jgi:acetolactate synthase-1/2/3 large subunit
MEQGVDTVFGLLAGGLLPIYDGIFDVEDRLRVIGGRHESALGYMADGYARACGRPGVFLTIGGPGAANAMGSLGESWASNVPVLEITHNVALADIDKNMRILHQPHDQAGMLRHVADNVVTATRPEDIPRILQKMFLRFSTRRSKPQVLEVPSDVLLKEAEVRIPPKVDCLPVSPQESDIDRAVEIISKAKRPCIWAGGGAVTGDATSALVRLAESWEVPVVVSQGGKGAFPEDHPRFLGCASGQRVLGPNPCGDFLSACDLLLVAGSTLGHFHTKMWGLELPATIIHITLDAEMIGKVYPTELGIVADLRTTLERLVEAMESRGIGCSKAFQDEVRALKEESERTLWDFKPNETRTMRAVREVIPRDAICCFDPSAPAYASGRKFPIYHPRTYMLSHGWDSIGYGFPAAIGARAALPHRPVLCFTGDGSFQLNMQEMATAVQHDLPVITIIINDGSYGVLKGFQLERYGGRYIAADITGPDFVKWAEAYEVSATRVRTVDELCKALDQALRDGRNHVIDVSAPGGFNEFV